MSWSVKYLVASLGFAIAISSLPVNAAPEGVLEGRLTVLEGRPVQRAEETPAAQRATNYADYPLVVLSADGKQQVARVKPDEAGRYRVMLPTGNYILDVERWVAKRLRVRAQPFTIAADQTSHVDIAVMSGFLDEGTGLPE